MYCTVCGKELSRETKTIPALGHDWTEPMYEWAQDNSFCTARTHCNRDDSHILDVSVETTYEVITEPTTETEGLGRYTAVFEAPFETQTKDVVIEDFTKGKATVDGIDADSLYLGEVSFKVASENDQAVLVAIKEVAEDGSESYTRLICSTDAASGEHSFTLTVDQDVTIVLAFKGDVNLDGAVKASDATMAKRALAGTYQITKALAELTADVSGDGVLKSSDATMISRSLAGTYVIKW